MSRTKVSEWSSSASANTDINGININEGCPPSTLNNMGRELMSQIKNWQDGSSGDSATNSGTFTSSGTLAITGNVTLDGASGTSGQYLTSAGSGNTPTWVTPPTAFVSGMIMLWSGSSGTIPAGWLLCNGASGTPDLRNRFVVGATSTYAVDATGGSANSDLQAHNHTLTDPGHNHNYTSPVIGSSYAFTDQGIAPLVYFPTANGATTTTSTTGITLADAGSGDGTNANLPPYYALCYIMKS